MIFDDNNPKEDQNLTLFMWATIFGVVFSVCLFIAMLWGMWKLGTQAYLAFENYNQTHQADIKR